MKPSVSLSDLRACFLVDTPLADQLTDTLPEEPTLEYALHRFLRAWQRSGRLGEDEAVLLRQVVRWAPGGSIFPGALPSNLELLLSRAGLEWLPGNELRATPYKPTWLDEEVECDLVPQRRACDESFPGEPYLASIGYPGWRSAAQKEAAWEVLTTLGGETRVIVLPTGSGKSLCFQLLPRFDSGLTVVVVPTIALAIDQHRSALAKLDQLPGVNPLYFSSDEDPDVVAQALRDRRTRLLFTSPEACVSGRLRGILDQLATEGWLRNLVIDEGHLIETWGAHFRVEFQILAAKRREWLRASQDRLRTFLFSATMTKDCRGLLLGMFSEEGKGREFVCQRLRPEMIYFHRRFASNDDRDSSLIEALWHLPRPAILYVTEVAEARRYERLLREEQGFQRIACFHGETRRSERRDLLKRWGANQIDLMVATSAFGVGVDKPDVRAVLHACFPENLDRYYQEVGRGGRDGWSAVCLLMPTKRDEKTARGINVRLMTPELMQERWDAMFTAGRPVEGKEYQHRLPVDATRAGLAGNFTYAENIRWNKRLLLQLHRARRLELITLELEPANTPEERREWVEVRMNFPPDTTRLAELIVDERAAERQRFDQGFDQLNVMLKRERCAAVTLGALYGMKGDQRICGGCPKCRADEWPLTDCPPLRFPSSPAERHHCVMVDAVPDPREHRERDAFAALTMRCVSKELRRFFVPREHFAVALRAFCEALPENDAMLYRLDELNDETAVIAAPNERLVFLHIGSISQTALALGRDRSAIHLRCGVRAPFDAEGRDIHVRESCRFFHSPEEWLLAD
jgi:ATP-dependent DNA helicase RecQ